MCTSTDDCFCHEQVRQSRSPNSLVSPSGGAPPPDIASKSSVSRRLRARGRVAEQDLLEGVGAEAEAERLERDHLVGRDVAEVDLGPEVLDEPGLRGLRRRLEDQVVDVDLVDDLVDEAGAHLAVGRKMPAVPPSRPSVITFQAPASSSSLIHSTHW